MGENRAGSSGHGGSSQGGTGTGEPSLGRLKEGHSSQREQRVRRLWGWKKWGATSHPSGEATWQVRVDCDQSRTWSQVNPTCQSRHLGSHPAPTIAGTSGPDSSEPPEKGTYHHPTGSPHWVEGRASQEETEWWGFLGRGNQGSLSGFCWGHG